MIGKQLKFPELQLKRQGRVLLLEFLELGWGMVQVVSRQTKLWDCSCLPKLVFCLFLFFFVSVLKVII